ncbi:Anti-sigma regulatory factor (Ser/Thr protein kinase) [Streptomyces sp. 3213]|nr:Anti-sigma regulatory factor (Ser/Thr protein kinase) [Streptomyces sp. 3213] [Streptomyces sp. 3213.3]
MTPPATVARTGLRATPRLRVYPGFNMSFERDEGSTDGVIADADRAVPGRARVIVRAGLRYWGWPGLIESADVLVTELVTNALEHGGGDVGLRVYLTDTHLLIEVRDGSHQLPVLRKAAPDDENGRGLLLVRAISDAWGVSSDGMTTWCSLPLVRRNGDMEHDGVAVIPDLGCAATSWVQKVEFRANRHVVGNAYRYTRLYLNAYLAAEHGFGDIEDLATIGRVLMANAFAHTCVPEYAVITMRWALLQSGELVFQVHDGRVEFPDFDKAVTWEPAEGERPRGLWTARRLGAEISYAPTDAGKIVQALIKPRALPV